MKYTHSIKCPYCGWEDFYNVFENENRIFSHHVVVCQHCDRPYVITLETSSKVSGIWKMEFAGKAL